MVRPSCCIVKEGIPSTRTYLPTYLYFGHFLSFYTVQLELPKNELQQAIDFYEAQQKGHQEFDIWDSSRRRPLTAKEVEKFDKVMHEFFKNYKSPIGSESG